MRSWVQNSVQKSVHSPVHSPVQSPVSRFYTNPDTRSFSQTGLGTRLTSLLTSISQLYYPDALRIDYLQTANYPHWVQATSWQWSRVSNYNWSSKSIFGGYYIPKKMQVENCVLCLTNLSVWHTFLVTNSALQTTMKIAWYSKFSLEKWSPDTQQNFSAYVKKYV